MAFNINAKVVLSGPKNIGTVRKAISKGLRGINVPVKISITKGAAGQLKAFNAALTSVEANLKRLTASATTAKNSMAGMAGSTTRLGNATAGATKGIAKAGAAAKKTGSQIEAFGKDAALAIRRFAAFTIATGAIFGFVRAVQQGISQAISFQRELIKITQVTGKAGKDLQGLTNTIDNLSTTLGVNANELLDVARTFAQTGQSLDQVRASLRAVARASLAPTFGSLQQTTEGVIAALNQFNISADKTEQVLGSLNAVSKKFAVESEDLISVIRRAGGVFAASTPEFQKPQEALNELISIFTAVRSTTRESADSIGTGLRTIFARIQRPQTIEFLKQFNVELVNAEGQFIGFFNSFKELSNKLSALQKRGDTVTFGAIVEELGGIRQLKNLIPAIVEFEKAEKARKVALAGTASITKDVVLAQQTLSVQLDALRQRFGKLIRDIAGSDTFQNLAKFALTAANAFITLADALRPAIPLLTTFAALKLSGAAFGFASGFIGGIGKGGKGGGKSVIGGGAGGASGAASKAKAEATKAAVTANTAEIQKNTVQLIALNKGMGTLGSISSKTVTVLQTLSARIPILIAAMKGVAVTTATPLGRGRKPTVAKLGSGGSARPKFGMGGSSRQKFAAGGLASKTQTKIGAAILDGPQGIATPPLNVITPAEVQKASQALGKGSRNTSAIKGGKPLTLQRSALNENTAKTFDSSLEKGITEAVKGTSSLLAKDFGLPVPTVPGKAPQDFFDSINRGVKGSLFESVLEAFQTGGKFNNKPDINRPFDFETGLVPKLADNFDGLKGISFIDAKLSQRSAGPDNLRKKAVNQLVRDLPPAIPLKGAALSKLGGFGGAKGKALLRKRLNDSTPLQGKVGGTDSASRILTSADAAGMKVTSTTSGKQVGAFLKKQGIRLDLNRGGTQPVVPTIPSLVTPGEFAVNSKGVAQAGGKKALDKTNAGGDASNLANVDPANISQVPGIGTRDTVKADLPVGSYIINRGDSLAAIDSGVFEEAPRLFANRGGSVGRSSSTGRAKFAGGGGVGYGGAIQVITGATLALSVLQGLDFSSFEGFVNGIGGAAIAISLLGSQMGSGAFSMGKLSAAAQAAAISVDTMAKKSSLITGKDGSAGLGASPEAQAFAGARRGGAALKKEATEQAGVVRAAKAKAKAAAKRQAAASNKTAVLESQRTFFPIGHSKAGQARSNKALEAQIQQANALELKLLKEKTTAENQLIIERQKEIEISKQRQANDRAIARTGQAFKDTPDGREAARRGAGAKRRADNLTRSREDRVASVRERLAARRKRHRAGIRPRLAAGGGLPPVGRSTRLFGKSSLVGLATRPPLPPNGKGLLPPGGIKVIASTLGKVLKPGIIGAIAALAIGPIADAVGKGFGRTEVGGAKGFRGPGGAKSAKVFGGIKGGLQGAALGAGLGMVVAGPVGAAVGAAVGGVAGATIGLLKAAQEQVKFESLDALAVASDKFGDSLERLGSDFKNVEKIDDFAKATESLSKQVLRTTDTLAGMESLTQQAANAFNSVPGLLFPSIKGLGIGLQGIIDIGTGLSAETGIINKIKAVGDVSLSLFSKAAQDRKDSRGRQVAAQKRGAAIGQSLNLINDEDLKKAQEQFKAFTENIAAGFSLEELESLPDLSDLNISELQSALASADDVTGSTDAFTGSMQRLFKTLNSSNRMAAAKRLSTDIAKIKKGNNDDGELFETILQTSDDAFRKSLDRGGSVGDGVEAFKQNFIAQANDILSRKNTSFAGFGIDTSSIESITKSIRNLDPDQAKAFNEALGSSSQQNILDMVATTDRYIDAVKNGNVELIAAQFQAEKIAKQLAKMVQGFDAFGQAIDQLSRRVASAVSDLVVVSGNIESEIKRIGGADQTITPQKRVNPLTDLAGRSNVEIGGAINRIQNVVAGGGGGAAFDGLKPLLTFARDLPFTLKRTVDDLAARNAGTSGTADISLTDITKTFERFAGADFAGLPEGVKKDIDASLRNVFAGRQKGSDDAGLGIEQLRKTLASGGGKELQSAITDFGEKLRAGSESITNSLNQFNDSVLSSANFQLEIFRNRAQAEETIVKNRQAFEERFNKFINRSVDVRANAESKLRKTLEAQVNAGGAAGGLAGAGAGFNVLDSRSLLGRRSSLEASRTNTQNELKALQDSPDALSTKGLDRQTELVKRLGENAKALEGTNKALDTLSTDVVRLGAIESELAKIQESRLNQRQRAQLFASKVGSAKNPEDRRKAFFDFLKPTLAAEKASRNQPLKFEEASAILADPGQVKDAFQLNEAELEQVLANATKAIGGGFAKLFDGLGGTRPKGDLLGGRLFGVGGTAKGTTNDEKGLLTEGERLRVAQEEVITRVVNANSKQIISQQEKFRTELELTAIKILQASLAFEELRDAATIEFKSRVDAITADDTAPAKPTRPTTHRTDPSKITPAAIAANARDISAARQAAGIKPVKPILDGQGNITNTDDVFGPYRTSHSGVGSTAAPAPPLSTNLGAALQQTLDNSRQTAGTSPSGSGPLAALNRPYRGTPNEQEALLQGQDGLRDLVLQDVGGGRGTPNERGGSGAGSGPAAKAAAELKVAKAAKAKAAAKAAAELKEARAAKAKADKKVAGIGKGRKDTGAKRRAVKVAEAAAKAVKAAEAAYIKGIQEYEKLAEEAESKAKEAALEAAKKIKPAGPDPAQVDRDRRAADLEKRRAAVLNKPSAKPSTATPSSPAALGGLSPTPQNRILKKPKSDAEVERARADKFNKERRLALTPFERLKEARRDRHEKVMQGRRDARAEQQAAARERFGGLSSVRGQAAQAKDFSVFRKQQLEPSRLGGIQPTFENNTVARRIVGRGLGAKGGLDATSKSVLDTVSGQHASSQKAFIRSFRGEERNRVFQQLNTDKNTNLREDSEFNALRERLGRKQETKTGNSGFGTRLPDGGTTSQVDSIKPTVETFAAAQNTFGQHVGALAKAAEKLENMNGLTVQFETKVQPIEVLLNGAQLIAEATPTILKNVMSQLSEKIKEMAGGNDPTL